MSQNREHETDEPQGVKYPSPDAEVMDSGPFYNTGSREDDQDHQENHDHLHGHVDMHEHEHADLSGQEAGTPQEHLSRPANLEELQLAAQLGHGLAGTTIMPATDPNMHVDDPNLRSIMPHPDPEDHDDTSYVQDASNADSMVQHPIQASLLSGQYGVGSDGIPPRKRSKVSRACDECRRKKIKCDAISDTGDPPCSSCARSSTRCLFSRVPQKRGPSKGYIKELADRIHSIEHKLGSENGLTLEELDKLFPPSRPRTEEAGRKRPFSSISTGDASTPGQARQAPWGSEPRALQPAPSADDGQAAAAYSSSSLAPQPTAAKGSVLPSKTSAADADVSLLSSDELPEIDDGVLHDYLMFTQPVFPILPNSRERLQALISQVPASIAIAFANALQAVTGHGGDPQLASSLLNSWESSDATATQEINLVHAQTLLMLIVDADWRVSPTLPFLVARAIALANTMKLWKQTSLELASELDSDDQLAMRVWWSLVLVDRWHAAGTGKPSQIPDSSVVVPSGLESIVGDTCFHLIRLAKLLNRISFAISTMPAGASTAEPWMAAILNDYIENYREDLPVHIEPTSHPTVHLAYWHCRLLVTLLTPGATSAENMWPTKEMVKLLAANSELRTPLLNHFVSLNALSLGGLARIDKSRDEAAQLIKEIIESPGSVWDSVRERLTNQARPASSAEATASQSLQHLADLATAHEGLAGETGDLSLGPSLSSGYLDAV